jgi:transcriptional regulator with XRE-family HTH domain
MDELRVSPLTVEIAAILREYQARYGLTQGAMGSAAGISQSHMSAILAGTKSLDIDQLEAISVSVGTDIDDVVERAVAKVRDEGEFPDVPNFTVRGVVETANAATRRGGKRKDAPGD